MKRILLPALAVLAATAVSAQPEGSRAAYDLNKGRTLYTVGYVHLDTQWNWDYATTIDVYLKRTLERNFELFEQYPQYVFTFTGARRYRMMKEYYPALYERMLGYMSAGRWYAGGSCVEEGEVNVSSSESMIREVLYGNAWYQREFGRRSVDYMLPDCFGFVATVPSVLAHAGVKGFSTQKLTWRSAAGIPFNVGVWEGPDGKGVIAALNATNYAGRIPERLDRDSSWVARMGGNFEKYGLRFDYRYYGFGDRGGAPRTEDVQNATGSLKQKDSKINVVLTESDRMFRDITPSLRRRLPRYSGDLLLVEHSAGSTTSQVFMKRMNRKNELLAKAAEQAAVMAELCGAVEYPFDKINEAWELILGSQMHDILPGTSIPRAYEYSWNDEFVAANLLSSVLVRSVGGVAARMDTRVEGTPVVVYNPAARERDDVAEVEMELPAGTCSVAVFDAAGSRMPSQVVSRSGDRVKFIFRCTVPAMGMKVFGIAPSPEPESAAAAGVPSASGNVLENEYYTVTIAPNGDIASVYDKTLERELLDAPAGLQFLRESPREWPAWNMDWADRKQPYKSLMDKNVSIRVVENGVVRATLEVCRQGEGSRIAQRISLAAGEAGRRVEIDNRIDWQSRGVSLKAAFPLAASNPEASYSLNTAAVRRGNNDSMKFEVPSRKWFDLTHNDGRFGISVLEDCRYGSDKPDDNTLRLTLMFTPEANVERFTYQATQDFGIHDFKYALYGHGGDWRNGTPWQAEFLNQPLLAFGVGRHAGELGSEVSFASPSDPQADVMAFKKMEDAPYYIIRLNELNGSECRDLKVRFPWPVAEVFEVDGSEQRLADGKAVARNGELATELGGFGIRSFAVGFAAGTQKKEIEQVQLALDFNADIISRDDARADGRIGETSRESIPAELLPGEITAGGIRFAVRGAETGHNNAIECRGQRIALPAGDYDRLWLLAAAEDHAKGIFTVDGAVSELDIACWTGFVGQHYAQAIIPDSTAYKTISIENPYLRRDEIAWFGTHCHAPSRNLAYRYCYLYKYVLDIEPGARELTLPDNPYIKIVAITAAEKSDEAVPLIRLSDGFEDYPAFHWRDRPKFNLSHR